MGSVTIAWSVDLRGFSYVSFTATAHLMVTIEGRSVTNTIIPTLLFNQRGGSNSALSDNGGTIYSQRESLNGGADATLTSQVMCQPIAGNTISANDAFIAQFWIDNNQAGDRKIITGTVGYGGDTSSATAPTRTEFTCKFDNTTAQISNLDLILSTGGTGSINNPTIITVWGYN